MRLSHLLLGVLALAAASAPADARRRHAAHPAAQADTVATPTTVAELNQALGIGAPAQACQRLCPMDPSPCDPIQFKVADGRCSGMLTRN